MSTPITEDPRTIVTDVERRTEYVVCIPDDSKPMGRREVNRYRRDDNSSGELTAETLARNRCYYLQSLGRHPPAYAFAYPDEFKHHAEAYVVEQVLTIVERRL